MRILSSCFFTALIFLFSVHSIAQILPREDEQQNAGLEDLYDKFEAEEDQKSQKRQAEERAKKAEEKARAEKEFTKLSELVELSPFEDIAVIQRRYLPKTSRFELSGSGLFSTNNQYFNNIGLGLRGAYYFQEKYGVELTYMFFTSSERPITQGLIDNQRIETSSLVEPESFYSAVFKWSPLYGKIAWFQQKIIPYDFYFTPGIGITNTKTGGSDMTVAMGMGQLFALSKSLGVRWDFNWNFYQTDVVVDGVKKSRNQNDLYLGVGLSYFIPEATYR